MARRFIFHGGTRERNTDGSVRQVGIAHNSAFEFAAKNVAKDYPDFDGIGSLRKITCAEGMVNTMNGAPEDSILSLDTVSHGSPVSLNFSVMQDENCGFVTTFLARTAANLFSTFRDDINSFGAGARYFSQIQFGRFAKNARVQIHGCSAAGELMGFENIAAHLSKLLYAAGKTRAFVIGHTQKSNPNIAGEATTLQQQDYRHGRRAVFHNGNVVLQTVQKGFIPDETIQSKIP